MVPLAARIAVFELRQQLRGHVFWVVLAISALMVLGSLWVDELRVGLADDGLRNGAAAIVRTHVLWSLFFMFTAAAFVSDAALRDDSSGLAPIIAALPVPRVDTMLGRFAGACAAVLLCFVSVPVALALGPYAPWVASETVGPLRLDAFVFAFFVLALPNLFLSSAVFFGLAAATRSLSAAMLGAVALLIVYGVGMRLDAGPLAAVIEPFGFAAYAQAVASWPAAARTTVLPPLSGALLLNRLLWLTIGCGLLSWAIALARLHTEEPRRRLERAASPPPRSAAVDLPCPRFTTRTAVAQFVARSRLEAGQLVRSPVFAVLLILGMANSATALWSGSVSAPDAPTTGAIVEALIEAFRLVPMVVVLFFAGELVWNERAHQVDALIGTAPIPDAAFLLPKLLALVLVLAVLASAAAATAAGVALVRGYSAGDWRVYLLWYVLPATYDWSLMAVLALFFQAAAPNKVAGWGLMVLYLIASLALERLGLDNPIYRYGRYPGWPLPEPLSGAQRTNIYRVYWGAAAVVLMVVALGLVGRGGDERLVTRLHRLPSRLRGLTGWIGAAAMSVFLAFAAVLAAGI